MLLINDINSYYDDVQVLRNLSLDVHEGEVLCLLGRNGAGKTTLLKSIMGIVRPRSGSILLNDTALESLPAHEIASQRVGYVPQGRRLFPQLTVAENLAVGDYASRTGQSQRERVLTLFPVLRERLKQKAGTLSGGEQQMLATGRALSVDPILLLMDEPTEGLQPSMIQLIRDVIVGLKREGVTTVVVEQRVDAVLQIADRVAFVENGTIPLVVDAAELKQDDTLINRYVGVSHQSTASSPEQRSQ